MANKYLEKMAGIPDLFPKSIGHGIERFMEGPANRMASHVVSNRKAYGAAYATGAVGYATGKHAGKKEALDKAAGIGSALKAFAGHATGKTLHGAEIKEATRKGLIDSGAKHDSAVKIDHELREAKKGPLFESTTGLKLKRHLARSGVAAAGYGAVAGAYGAGQHEAENRYLKKTAGVASALKEFPGHLTGKTLAKTRTAHALENMKHAPSKDAGSNARVALSKAKQKSEVSVLKKKHEDAKTNAVIGGWAAGSAALVANHIRNNKKAKK
jgi:hypothetical protein